MAQSQGLETGAMPEQGSGGYSGLMRMLTHPLPPNPLLLPAEGTPFPRPLWILAPLMQKVDSRLCSAFDYSSLAQNLAEKGILPLKGGVAWFYSRGSNLT